ncbi:hypothetical protein F4V43_04535 [Paenibacillus spiritus]|uniref:Uncharacterized protein n=1 Tax=Paenibacillus spiritus TaxID=2496557 RepID=A0A5J5GEP4_9BACL|nr:hypothetical protein [Paenibacillus spiritus]KAA9006233.1 hypothetical protein F4V43_04535 [Paenibacillus spiritus]
MERGSRLRHSPPFCSIYWGIPHFGRREGRGMALIPKGRLAAALLATLLFAFLLPALAGLDGSVRHGGERPVMASSEPVQLSGGTLVDELAALPLTLPIGRAGWSDGALSLDLQVTDSAQPPGEVYLNIADVLDFAFGRTDNVNQVLLRIIAVDK